MTKLLFPILLVLLFSSCGSEEGRAPIPVNNDLTFSGEAQLYALNEAITNDPESADLYFKRGRLYYQFFLLNQAQVDIDKALTLNESHGKSYMLKGMILFDRGLYNDALIAAKRAEELKVAEPELLALLAKANVMLNQAAISAQYLQRLQDISPQSSEVYLIQAMTLMAKGDTTLATQYLKTALQRNDKNREASLRLIPIYYKKKHYDSCLAIVAVSRQFYPNDQEFMYFEGLLYEELNQTVAAMGVYGMILQRDPDHLLVNEQIAKKAFSSGNLPEADRRYRKLLQVRPGYKEYLEKLASINEQQEKGSEALVYYKKILAIDSTSSTARSGIDRVYKRFPELKPAPTPVQR